MGCAQQDDLLFNNFGGTKAILLLKRVKTINHNEYGEGQLWAGLPGLPFAGLFSCDVALAIPDGAPTTGAAFRLHAADEFARCA